MMFFLIFCDILTQIIRSRGPMTNLANHLPPSPPLPSSKRGAFISFEGGEGVGKSRLMNSLEPLLNRELGVRTITTREPGGTPQGELIRTLFAKHSDEEPWLPLTEAFLVCAARAQHVQVKIRPALEKGTWVLCDRFADSTRVYQGMVAGATLESLISLATDGLEPDLTLILDCPVDLAMSRTQARQLESPLGRVPRPGKGLPSLQAESAPTDSIGRFDLDGHGRHEQRRQAYLTLAQRYPTRIVVIDGSQSPQEVLDQTLSVIRSRFFPSSSNP